MLLHNCLHCGTPIVKKKRGQKYCKHDCSVESLKIEDRKVNTHRQWNLSSGTVGAIHELVTCVDLMKKGYQVFRAMSPSSLCDLVAYKDNKYMKIEVTTGYVANGRFYFPQKKAERFDTLAIVFNGEVTYTPPLDGEEGESH